MELEQAFDARDEDGSVRDRSDRGFRASGRPFHDPYKGEGEGGGDQLVVIQEEDQRKYDYSNGLYQKTGQFCQ